MRFTKMQGAGNDYLFIDARSLEADWPALSRSMSDRHFGVGSDGIILILPSNRAHLKMRMFNADGSEGEMCGNGIRCFAKYVIERGLAHPDGTSLTVETLAGVRSVAPITEGGKVVAARVAMGVPELHPQEVPVSLPSPPSQTVGEAAVNYPLGVNGTSLLLTFVSMGNPHAVAFMDESIDRFPLHAIGPQVEHHSMFPRRVNFEIVNVLDSASMKARVWERGSGETMACGSGACAIAVAARLLGRSTGPIDINLPGGTLKVAWDGEGEVYLEGDAVEVFEGDWTE